MSHVRVCEGDDMEPRVVGDVHEVLWRGVQEGNVVVVEERGDPAGGGGVALMFGREW